MDFFLVPSIDRIQSWKRYSDRDLFHVIFKFPLTLCVETGLRFIHSSTPRLTMYLYGCKRKSVVGVSSSVDSEVDPVEPL